MAHPRIHESSRIEDQEDALSMNQVKASSDHTRVELGPCATIDTGNDSDLCILIQYFTEINDLSVTPN